MFDLKTLVRKFDQRVLAAPQSPGERKHRQQHLMVGALTLLLVALGMLLYKDRDFWFPDMQQADELEQGTPAVTAANAAKHSDGIVHPLTPTSKKHIGKQQAKVRGPVTSAKRAASTVAAAKPPAAVKPQAPLTATANRTALPPLEVEVVAGDNHRTVRPGSSSVRVDLQPGTRPQAAADTVAANRAPSAPVGVTSNAAERVQMSTGTANVVSHQVAPGYPLLARQMKVQGSVILHALISRDGLIQDLKVLNGPPILAGAAQEAVKQWHFKPHFLGNEPVETQATITVNFTISTN